MTDPINEWRQKGAIHLWRYKPEKSGLNGWHFHADEDGVDSLVEILELLSAADYPAKRTLSVAKPSDRVIRGPFSPLGERKIIAPVSLQLLIEAAAPDDHWLFEGDGERLKLHLGRKSAAQIIDGMQELKRRGYGDFTVGPTRGDSSQCIWLW